MIYDRSRGFVFLKTRKTAGTSIEIELSKHADAHAVLTPIHPEEAERRRIAGRGAQNHDCPKPFREMTPRDALSTVRRLRRPRQRQFWNHMSAEQARSRIPEWDDITKVAVVRNPWAVVASRFHMERDRRADIETVDDLFDKFGVDGNWPIYTIGDEIAVDEIIRFESLEDELPAILAKVGIDVSAIPRAKVGTGRLTYRELLTPAQADRIASECRSEIQAFGYTY